MTLPPPHLPMQIVVARHVSEAFQTFQTCSDGRSITVNASFSTIAGRPLSLYSFAMWGNAEV